MNRIERLKSLSAGWLGEGSKAPDAHLVAWLEAHSEVLARAPYKIAVSPVADGSVALQWMMGSRELTAELRPDDTIYLFVDYRDTDDFDEGTTQLDPQALETFILAGGLGHAA